MAFSVVATASLAHCDGRCGRLEATDFLQEQSKTAVNQITLTKRSCCSKLNDRIFIFYSDHGGVGVIEFPFGQVDLMFKYL